jgi:hypothetical protein
MSLTISVNSNPATAPMLSVMLTPPAESTSATKVATGSVKGGTAGSSNLGKGYREVSGNAMDIMCENIIVTAGKELNLMSVLNGNLVVQKGARAKVMGTVNGTVTNYGTLDIMGEINGDVINQGGVVNNMGEINGEFKE